MWLLTLLVQQRLLHAPVALQQAHRWTFHPHVTLLHERLLGQLLPLLGVAVEATPGPP
jgi:hypothetical protein